MYQVITEIIVDGKREMDSIFPKVYVRKKAAERNATSHTGVRNDGKKIETKCYVRGFLHPTTEQEAKDAYCKGKSVWVDGEYGQVKVTPSWEYGSHASKSELFYRGVYHCRGYYCDDYKGNYYIEEE